MKTILVDAVYCLIIKKDNKFQIFQDMFELLEKYQNKKIILTSAGDDKRELYNLNNMPYLVFTLKNNPGKSDPQYYNILLRDFSIKKEDVIYFEHDENAVKSAQSVGINTYFYDNEKKDLESLKQFFNRNLEPRT